MTDRKDRERESGGTGERRNEGTGGREKAGDTLPLPIEWEDDEVASSELKSLPLPLPPAPAPPLPLPHTVPVEAENQRLDLFLTSRFSQTSRSAIQRAISGGDITVNGKTVKPSHRIRAGEVITGEIPAAPVIDAVPEDIPLDIVYEDEEIIVVNKPAGMVTHPGAGAQNRRANRALP